ncbi:glycosyltransferase family 4 protein [Flavobacterium daejeonense]|uniref:glycosyltransferase family 4 protein n=1 Tax=Flavobacterium daejeonense TaxID=350893 RepID=UPI00055905C0|nr:glycosyltransferase family 1 protein [Flavobacterium daejeonense]
MKKILLNGLQLGKQNSGVQYYTEYLLKALQQIKSLDFEFDILENNSINGKGGSSLKRIFFEFFLLKFYIKKSHVNLYHSPHYILPNRFKIPAIVTIHDLITLDFPDLCKYQSVFYFNFFLKKTIHNAEIIIAVSHTVKKDIIRHFDVDAHKIRVIYLGIDPIFKRTIDIHILKKYNLPEKYILFVGNIEGKKNLTSLLLAFNELINQNKIEHKLVLVGKKGWKNKSVYKTISKYNLKQYILFTGYVPKKDLPVIYSMSDLFVFPSIYEGFGIPPLEAMACGIPVIVSNQGASPEICGDACLLVNPYDTHEMAKSIEMLLNNKELRQNKINLGLERVKQFNWEKTAKETLKVYEEAISI